VLLPGTFLLAILIGAAVLLLPAMHHGGVGPLEALFTATSAVCVTGLVVVDTGTEFTRAGQAVILALIQLGGLGIMTFGVLALVLVGRRVGLAQEAAVRDIYTSVGGWRVGRLLGIVVAATALCETFGYFLLRMMGEGRWSALFHSISAFCNSGFSTNSDSLQRAGPGAALVIVALIVVGGLGFTTLVEIARNLWPRRTGKRRFSLHARLVFTSSIILVGLGTIAIALLEGGDWGNALFMSVSTRTAGFDTVPVQSLHAATLLVMIPLMFIGASPGSTGGGIKTTTAAVIWLSARKMLRGGSEVTIHARTIADTVIRRAFAVLFFSASVVLTTIFLLHILEGDRPENLLAYAFEAVSACATVGLSTGITADLTVASKLVLCGAMFIGRVGSLSVFILLVLRAPAASRVRYPEERVLIG
jgi:trk system potassium uptake protein TrkH